LRFQASALLLAIMMPLTQGQAAEHEDDAAVESLRQEVQTLNKELSDFTTERRDRIMADIEDVLSAIDDRIATLDGRLKEDWDSADRVARAQAQTALASLRRERSRVTEWYQRMQDSADFTWESMKDGFNDAFNELSDAWQDAEQNIRKAGEKAGADESG
jgi:prefoldin subunit 5